MAISMFISHRKPKLFHHSLTLFLHLTNLKVECLNLMTSLIDVEYLNLVTTFASESK